MVSDPVHATRLRTKKTDAMKSRKKNHRIAENNQGNRGSEIESISTKITN